MLEGLHVAATGGRGAGGRTYLVHGQEGLFVVRRDAVDVCQDGVHVGGAEARALRAVRHEARVVRPQVLDGRATGVGEGCG